MAKLTRRQFLRQALYGMATGGLTALTGCGQPAIQSGQVVKTAPPATAEPTLPPTVAQDTPTSAPPVKPDGPGNVIVVGAGLAGLTAALNLHEAGWTVTVLEGRGRVGGRVNTVTKSFSDGLYAEGGGEFIDAERVHTEMHAYIKRFDLEIEDVGYDEFDSAYYINEQLFPYEEAEEILGEDVIADIDRFWEETESLAEQIDDMEDPTTSPNAAELDSRTAADWLDELELHPTARLIVDHGLRGEYDEPSRLSLLFLAQQLALYADVEDDEFEAHRIKGGNNLLPEAMTSALDGAVELNSRVTAVTVDDTGVTVTHQRGESKADYVIITAAFPTIRDIAFDPPLPDALQKAVNELNYGSHTKTLLQYERRFWLDEELSGDTESELPVGWTWECTDQQEGDLGIMSTYTSGTFADEYLALGKEELIEEMVNQIETMYPGSKDIFQVGRAVVWPNTPFNGGAYSAYAPGQVMGFWNLIRQPHGRIYFAGEHTDTLFVGFMEGAIRSGQRVARELIGT